MHIEHLETAMYMIREIRQTVGLTQSELARRVGLRQSEISRIENGQRRLTVERLLAIAGALGVEPAELLQDPPRAA